MVKFYLRMLLAALLLIPSSVVLADDVTVLQVNLNDGSYINFAFADKPAVSFKADSITVASDQNTLQAEMSEVKNFLFLSEATGISSIVNDGSEISVGKAFLRNLQEGETVRVFNAVGQQVMAVKAVGGSVNLDLNRLGNGVYVIRTAKSTAKVLIK